MSEGYKAAERDLMLRATREADVVITTALIPGRPAPRLVRVRGARRCAPASPFFFFLYKKSAYFPSFTSPLYTIVPVTLNFVTSRDPSRSPYVTACDR